MASENVLSAGENAIAFLELMADAVEIPTTDIQGLAVKLGMEPRDLYRWRKGQHGISLPHVMTMLKASGALEALKSETRRSQTTGRAASDPAVAETVEALVEQASQLTPLVNRLAQLLSGGGHAGSGMR